MNQEQLTFYVPLGICIVLFGGLFLATPKVDDGPTRWALLLAWLSRYVTPRRATDDAHDRPFSAFEQAERAPFVQPVQASNDALAQEDATRIDAVARLLAAGVMGEGAAIELLFDGVRRGGSKRYMAIRDAARARAGAYGWKAPQAELAPAPEPPRVVRVYEGRPDERLVEL